MSQDVERYLYFTVALLKDSFALDTLWQDALKYHMIDQPGKLIAIRLTEYYELIASGVLPSVAGVPIMNNQQRAASNGVSKEETTVVHFPNSNSTSSAISQTDDYSLEAEPIIATSPDVAQNAEAAADYWTLL
jgi:hypothetical protein